MATIALPTIKDELGYDDGSLQWILTAYALTVRALTTYPSIHLPCESLWGDVSADFSFINF